jgi:hypothetical protein
VCSSSRNVLAMDTTQETVANVASLGGIARKNSLTPEERSDIARRAVEARWEKAGKKPAPIATHEGLMDLTGKEVSCAVLNDGRRILTQSSFYLAIGRSRTPKAGTGVLSTVDGLPFFLQAEVFKPFITQELLSSTAPVHFTDKSGRRSVGFDAELLPMVAEVYLKFRDSLLQTGKKVPKPYERIFVTCDLLTRGLARVGIRALVDEATGYQYERPKKELQEQLRKFLAEGLVRYASGFPADYLKHLCRLKGVPLRSDMRLPKYFGKLTGNLIYRRIAPGLLKALKDRRAERGKPGNKLYQWTSEDKGYPALMMQLGTVVGLMKLHTNYDEFKAQLDQVAPVYPDVPGLFDNSEDWDTPHE